MASSLQLKAVIDVGISAIISPVSGCGLTGEEVVLVEITNYGDEIVSAVPVAYQVDGGGIPEEISLYPISPGESAVYYFIILADLSLPGDHSLCAWTIGPDADASNDTLCVVVNTLATPVVNLGPDDVICEEVVLDAENPGSVYLWNTGETTQTIVADETGVYSVTVTNPLSGCDDADTIEIIFETAPTAGFTYTISGLTVSFTNTSVNADAYNWDFGDGSTATTENPVYIYYDSGSYSVTLTASNTCDDDAASEILFVTPVTEYAQQEKLFTIYPNPANSVLEVLFAGDQIVYYKIKSLQSKIIFTDFFIHDEILSVQNLPEGIYIIEFENEPGELLSVEKFIKL